MSFKGKLKFCFEWMIITEYKHISTVNFLFMLWTEEFSQQTSTKCIVKMLRYYIYSNVYVQFTTK